MVSGDRRFPAWRLLAACAIMGWSPIGSVGGPLPSRSPDRTAGPLAEIERRIVTSDNPPVGGGHLAQGGSIVSLPGMATPLNPDGVVSVIDQNGGVYSTGSLIGDRFVLTAAHSVEAASIYSPDLVGFDTASGLSSGAVADIFIHPRYDGSLEGGYDLAVLELEADAPHDAPRYGLYTQSGELGALSVKAGHGRTGHGSTGYTSLDAHRRVGLNTYDATSVEFNNAFGMAMDEQAYLVYDFDSGLADNNAWQHHGVVSDLGFGIDEVNGVPGDSGGPTFIHHGADWLIAGVTSWGVGIDTDPPDVTPGVTDGSWGELSADTRVSVYADFVLSVLDGSYIQPITYAYSHGTVRPTMTWDRPNEAGTALSGFGPVPYHTHSFTVDATGEYDLESVQNFDAVIHLYEGVPNPNDPFAGLMAGNADGPDGPHTSRILDVPLSSGTTYTVVTSTEQPGEIGTFLNTVTGPGNAAAVPSVGGFTGSFAPSNWQFTTDHAEAYVQTDTAPDGLTVFGGDDGRAGDTDFTIDGFVAPTTLIFEWTYFTADDPGFDIFGVLLNDAFTWLSNGDELYGSYQLTLDPGDLFGFRVETVDGVKGAGVGTIYRFRVLGDLDGDGYVGIDDLNLVLGYWNQTVEAGNWSLGDPTGDAFVGIDDLNEVLGNWIAGTPPDIAANIPEPGTLILLAICGLSGVGRCRGRLGS